MQSIRIPKNSNGHYLIALKTKLPDTIIAATALVKNLILITRNISDFEDIEGLQIINSYDI